MTSKKSLFLRIVFKSSKGMWRPQYNTKQGFVNCKMVRSKDDHICENTDNECVSNVKENIAAPFN